MLTFLSFYEITSEESAELVQHINIYHPYGTLGNLRWQHNITGESVLSYGKSVNGDENESSSKNIKTFSERMDGKDSQITQIREVMRSANNVIFLGFGYHKQNMDLLFDPNQSKGKIFHIKCYATAYGNSESDLELIRRSLSEGLKIPNPLTIEILDCDCLELFEQYKMSLSFK